MIIKLLNKIAFTIISIILIIILSLLFYSSINIPYHDFMLFFSNSDFFWFDGRHLAMVSFTPCLIYAIVMISCVPFTKDNKVPKAFSYSGNLLALVSIMFLVLFNIVSLFVYFYIIFMSSYQICKEPPMLSHYFATNPAICKTIVNHDLS